MAQTFTFHLLKLECLREQEFDGDEPYLKLDQQRLWSTPRGHHMHPHAGKPTLFSAVDFVAGCLINDAGTQPFAPVFDASQYRIAGLADDHVLHLYEADTFGDDALGSTPISARDAGRGEIRVVLDADGAQYAITYRVELDAAAG